MSVIGSSQAALARGRRAVIPVPAACAALLAALLYLNTLDNPFVYDDFRLIVENTSILSGSNLQTVIVFDVTRPLVNLSYAIDTMVWGRQPFGYHLTNLLFHVLNVVLLFWVALLAAEDRARQHRQRLWVTVSPTTIATAAAVLFAVHPMLTQAVGYISSRSEVAYTTFFLLAFLAGRRWLLEGGKRWWMACVGLWVAALLTKESAAMLPFLLLAYDWFVLDADRAERGRRFLRLQLPMLAATLGAGAGRIALLAMVEYPGQTGPDWRYALVAVDAFWRYLAMFFVPRGQSIFHAVPMIDSAFSARALAGVGGLGLLGVVIWRLRLVHSLISIGLLWFTLMLVPSSVLFILGRGEPMAEHRAYLSGAGLFLAWGGIFGILWAHADRRRLLVAVTTVVFLAQLTLQTFIRNVIWHDPVVLSREAAVLAPTHWMPRILHAEALRQNGRCGEATVEYRAAIAIRPQDEFPYTRLAACLIEDHQLDEAEATLKGLLAVNPSSQDALMGLGVFAIVHGRLDEARSHFGQVLSAQPARERAKLLLAFVEGALPAADHQRVCTELQALNGQTVAINGCQTDTRHTQGESTDSARQ